MINVHAKKMKSSQVFEKIKENKVFWAVAWAICLVLFIILSVRFNKYRQGRIYYNRGVKCFKDYDYESAENYFRSAIWEKHTKRQECKIRINYALSIVTPITPNSVNSDNLDQSIERLMEARDFLVENGCANKDDSNGHNKKAQTLKEEIDDYIEYLKELNPEENDSKDDKQKESSTEDGSEGVSESDDKKNEEELKKEQAEFERKQAELKDKINAIEKEGLKERNDTLETYRQWNTDSMRIYSDRNW